MNIESVNNDILKLEQACTIIQSCENYSHFNRSTLMTAIIKEKNSLEDKRDRQIKSLESLH